MGYVYVDMEKLYENPGKWAYNQEWEVIDEELRKSKKVDSLGMLYAQIKYLPTGMTDPEPNAPPVS